MEVEEAKTYLKNYPCVCKYGSSPYACKDSEGCEFSKAIRTLIEKIDIAPTTTDRWIPVSERLPENRKKVHVTAYWHERFQVMDASYYGDGVWWCVPFNNCGKHMRKDLHVIAWKPDDEPYKESEA